MKTAVVQGVTLPFDLEGFCTPHWPRVFPCPLSCAEVLAETARLHGPERWPDRGAPTAGQRPS